MGRSVLVVDDEKLIRDLLLEAFRTWNHRADAADCGEKALEMLAEGSYDMVVTDAVMPGMSGLDLLRSIRQRDPTMRVVVLTGYAREDDIAKYIISGAAAYLVKPIRMEELRRVVDQVLDGAG